MSLCTPYQVDYSHVVAGKHFQSTKRRVRFVFGFASEAALRGGLKGSECRGDEHEVVLVWSCTSGKQLVLLDGEEILRNVQRNILGRNLKFEHAFSLGKHVLILTGEVSLLPFMDPGQKFDLKLNGISFFRLEKIYELGRTITTNTTANARLQKTISDENRLVQMAKQFSLQEVEMQLVENPKVSNTLAPQIQHQNVVEPVPQMSSRPVSSSTNFVPYTSSLHSPQPSFSKPIITRDPSFHPQQEPTLMSFMKPPTAAKTTTNTNTAGLPNEVHVIPDAPTYQTPQPKKTTNEKGANDDNNVKEEPWEVLVDFASSKDGCDESVLFPSHNYFDYYDDYVKRGGEAISHPSPMEPSAPSDSKIPVTISYYDPAVNGNVNETNHTGHRSRAYTAPSSVSKPSLHHRGQIDENTYIQSHSAHGYPTRHQQIQTKENSYIQSHSDHGYTTPKQQSLSFSNNNYGYSQQSQNFSQGAANGYTNQNIHVNNSYPYNGALQNNYYSPQYERRGKNKNIAQYFSLGTTAGLGKMI